MEGWRERWSERDREIERDRQTDRDRERQRRRKREGERERGGGRALVKRYNGSSILCHTRDILLWMVNKLPVGRKIQSKQSGARYYSDCPPTV